VGRQGNTQRISRSSVVCLFLKKDEKIFADERCAGLQAKNVKKAQKALQERCEACGKASLGQYLGSGKTGGAAGESLYVKSYAY